MTYTPSPPCECCGKPAKKVFGAYEAGVKVFVKGEEVGILEVDVCTRACARETLFGTMNQTPKLPKGSRLIELED